MKALKYSFLMILMTIFAGPVQAEDAPGERPERGEFRQKLLEEFDADGDGKLSADERKAAHEAGYGRHKRPDGPPPPPPGDTPEE